MNMVTNMVIIVEMMPMIISKKRLEVTMAITPTLAGMKKKAILLSKKSLVSSICFSFRMPKLKAKKSRSIPRIEPGMRIIGLSNILKVSPRNQKNSKIAN